MPAITFNAEDVPPSEGFAVIPPGRQLAMVTNSDLRLTKAGDGSYIWVEYTIVEGEHENRKLWGNFTWENKSADAVKVGQRQFSALCHAVGVLQPQTTEQLHGIPLYIDVAVKKSEQYGDQNEVRGWHPVAQGAAPVTAKPATAKPAAAQPASAKAPPPWAKPKAAA